VRIVIDAPRALKIMRSEIASGGQAQEPDAGPPGARP
jgi:sRNA-binding carbon storage regulator CsrA